MHVRTVDVVLNNRMNVFYDVPKVTQVDIICSWLEPVDVCKLDMATCCHRYRKELLDAFRSPECVLGYLEFQRDYISSWIKARLIKLNSISLNVKVLAPESNRKALLQIMGPTLNTLELMCGDYGDDSDVEEESEFSFVDNVLMCEIMVDCSQYCVALESLTMHGARLDKKFAALVQRNPKLKHITLTECTKVSSVIIAAIIACPGLEAVELKECVMTSEAFTCQCASHSTCTSVVLTSTSTINVGIFAVAFPKVATLAITVDTQYNLATIAAQCPHVKTAKILIREELELEHATTIANSWQGIQSLEIIHVDVRECACMQDVVLLFVDRCMSLERLVLAPLEPTYLAPARHLINEPNVSKIRELSASDLDEPSLIHILNKCKHLYTLSLHSPEPVELEIGEQTFAEFSLEHLEYSSVKELYLSNVLNFGSSQLLKLRNLHTLVLSYMGSDVELDRIDVLAFVQRCPLLHTLCIYDCETIDYGVVLAVLPIARRLYRLEYYSGPKTPHYREHPVAWMRSIPILEVLRCILIILKDTALFVVVFPVQF